MYTRIGLVDVVGLVDIRLALPSPGQEGACGAAAVDDRLGGRDERVWHRAEDDRGRGRVHGTAREDGQGVHVDLVASDPALLHHDVERLEDLRGAVPLPATLARVEHARKDERVGLDLIVQHLVVEVQGGSQLVVNVSRSLPDVIAEETLIGQVIANLVQNAVTAMKDIPRSNRQVQISADEIGDNQIQVTVSDAGEGLSTETIDHLFESFYTTRSDGLGLGLAICRSIIEAHGGHIRAENVPDGGAVFSFTLPVSGTV